MKEEFTRYLYEIGIKDLFYIEVVKTYDRVTKLISDEITDIFVTDYVESDGRRNYEDLILFTSGRIVEAQRFITQGGLFVNQISSYPLAGMDLNSTAYDFENASAESRLNAGLVFGPAGFGGLRIDLKASGNNCDFLTAVLKKYFLSRQ
jgi:hypothetical protein